MEAMQQFHVTRNSIVNPWTVADMTYHLWEQWPNGQWHYVKQLNEPQVDFFDERAAFEEEFDEE